MAVTAATSSTAAKVAESSMNPADIIWADATTADAAAKGAGLATFGVPEALAIGDLEFTPPRFAYAGGVNAY